MDGLAALVWVGFAANLIGSSAYIRATLKGSVRPNRVTYFLWSLVPFIAFAASVSDGVGWAALPTFASGFCPLLIFLASFYAREGVWKLGPLDWVCGVFSLLALFLWGVTESPFLAILFAIFGDLLAALPTLRKAWRRPETEASLTYLLGLVGPLTVPFVAQRFDFVELAFPCAVFLANAVLYTVIVFRRRALDPR